MIDFFRSRGVELGSVAELVAGIVLEVSPSSTVDMFLMSWGALSVDSKMNQSKITN